MGTGGAKVDYAEAFREAGVVTHGQTHAQAQNIHGGDLIARGKHG